MLYYNAQYKVATAQNAKTMSRNLLIATGIFHPESGGPATYLCQILPLLQAKNWQAHVLTYGDISDHAYPYPVTRVRRDILPLRLARYALASQKLTEWSDLIYIHTIDLPLIGSRKKPRVIKIVGDQAWERCIRKGWIPANEDIDDFQKREYGAKANWQKRLRSSQVQRADVVITPGEYLKRMVVGWGILPEKIYTIYNAMPEINRTALPTQNQARHELGLRDDPILLTAARLHPWKGIDHLIYAIQHIPHARLFIAGDGPVRTQLQQMANALSDRVHFLGQIPHARLQKYMIAADYFVLYSGYEGLSHSLLESLRMGTPVIASDKGGNPEVIQDGINGYLAPYIDRSALVDILRAALVPGKREQLAANTTIGMEKFSFNKMVEATHQLLSQYASQ